MRNGELYLRYGKHTSNLPKLFAILDDDKEISQLALLWMPKEISMMFCWNCPCATCPRHPERIFIAYGDSIEVADWWPDVQRALAGMYLRGGATKRLLRAFARDTLPTLLENSSIRNCASCKSQVALDFSFFVDELSKPISELLCPVSRCLGRCRDGLKWD